MYRAETISDHGIFFRWQSAAICKDLSSFNPNPNTSTSIASHCIASHRIQRKESKAVADADRMTDSDSLAAMYEPTAAEKAYYDELFQVALGGSPSRAVPQTSPLSGSAAVSFLSKSGLPRKTLRECWELAMDGKSEMHIAEFYVLMRTIALAQIEPEKALTKADILNSQGKIIQLPRFSGVQVATPASTPNAAVTATGQGAPAAGNPSPWEITKPEQDFYAQLWAQQETVNGMFPGQKAAAFLAKSRVEKGMLREIWNLSDMDKDGALSSTEFAIAMHLCICVSKRGLALPSVLPPELLRSLAVNPVTSNDGSSSSIAVDEAGKESISSSLSQIHLTPTPSSSSVDHFQQLQEPQSQPQAHVPGQTSPMRSAVIPPQPSLALPNLQKTESSISNQSRDRGDEEAEAVQVNAVLEQAGGHLESTIQRTQSEKQRVSGELERLKQRRQELLTSLEMQEKTLREETETLHKLDADAQALRTEVEGLESKVLSTKEAVLETKANILNHKDGGKEIESQPSGNVTIPSRQAPVLASQQAPGRPAPALGQEQQSSKANGVGGGVAEHEEDPWSALDTGGTENDWKNMDGAQGQADDFSAAFPVKTEQ